MIKALILTTCATIICSMIPALAKDEQVELTPTSIVQKTLRIGNSAIFLKMPKELIKEMEQFMEPELLNSILEFYRLKDLLKSLGPSPHSGYYNALQLRRYNPDETKIQYEEILGNRAIVVVKEIQYETSGYEGYISNSNYIFTMHDNRWMLKNIQMTRMDSIGSVVNIEVIEELSKACKELIREYNFEMDFRAKKEKEAPSETK